MSMVRSAKAAYVAVLSLMIIGPISLAASFNATGAKVVNGIPQFLDIEVLILAGIIFSLITGFFGIVIYALNGLFGAVGRAARNNKPVVATRTAA